MRATLRLRKDELAKHMVRANLTTASRLADAMKADRGTVSRVLSGKAKPGCDFIATLATVLNEDVSFSDLWEVVPTTDSGESK